MRPQTAAGGGMQNGAQPHGQFPPRGAAVLCPIFAENRLKNQYGKLLILK
ncbi:hypothetical protein BN938_2882 [Mucinivorans hirudinis]|uniref:Uncharacterized protein n=1 Tax=Mucinivorans hirudinis TaxID=1433126 RepID=A0A060RBI7_9BACT|nr:hypothetical protein BN938_2882 [Mucinivorans hirudinis]